MIAGKDGITCHSSLICFVKHVTVQTIQYYRENMERAKLLTGKLPKLKSKARRA
jgi:hypothetical protein